MATHNDTVSVFKGWNAQACEAWAKGQQVAVMRDGWSHTDPLLAGMWGGVAGVTGVLPDLSTPLRAYRSATAAPPQHRPVVFARSGVGHGQPVLPGARPLLAAGWRAALPG